MASTSRKAPPGTRSATRSSTSGWLLDPSIYEKLEAAIAPPSSEKKSGSGGSKKDSSASASSVSLRLKPGSMAEQTEPGNWQVSKSTRPKPKLANGKKARSDLVNAVDSRLISAFPVGKPFEQITDMIQCKHCKKPVYRPRAPEHIRDCLKKKQEKAQKKKEMKEAKEAAQRKERNGGISPTLRHEVAKTTSKLAESAKKTSKKRKAEGETAPKKKRKKDEPKSKNSRHKGPVDVERQCGVLMPNGLMCARSLTCKTHAMGLKRAVVGRSTRYDILLANYQKKNHAKQHRAAMEANAPPPEDIEDPADVDSEEEKETVMQAINDYYRDDPFTGAKTMGAPLATWDPPPISRRYGIIRLGGALKSAMDSVHGSRLFAISAFGGGGMFSGRMMSSSPDVFDADADAAGSDDDGGMEGGQQRILLDSEGTIVDGMEDVVGSVEM